LTYFQQALEIRDNLKVPGDTADTLHNLAYTDTKLGQYDQALAQYLKAIDLHRNNGDTRGAAMDSYDMASVFQYQGRLGAALKAREDALSSLRSLKDRGTSMSEILSGYGESLAQLGRADDAQRALNEALSLARELKNENLVAQCLRYQGDVASFQGDYKAAASLYDQSLQSAKRARDDEKSLLAKVAIARNDVRLGRAAATIPALRTLVQEADSKGLKHESVQSSLDLAEALIATRALPQARTEVERAITRSEKLGLKTFEARGEYQLATVFRLSGNKTLAADHYRQFQNLLDAVHKEAGDDRVMKRADFAAMSDDANRWLAAPKS
jgi:tetratricopeptide (TPR) repeat protein